MARLGLTLNEAKTSIRDARRERFDFLGYAFGRISRMTIYKDRLNNLSRVIACHPQQASQPHSVPQCAAAATLTLTFGPHHYRKDGHWYLGASPSKKSVRRLKQKVGEILVPGNQAPWPEVRDRLNRLLRGWSAYFSYGTRLVAYRAVDNHVYDSVRCFLVRRHKVQSRKRRGESTRILLDGLNGRPGIN